MQKSLGLLDARTTLRQRIIVGAWYVLLAAIIIMWLIPVATELSEDYSFGELLHGFGLLFGLFAAFFALTQFVLMGRLLWVERTFGADHLAAYHRINGYLAIVFIVLHPILIVLAHSIINHTTYTDEYISTLMTYAFTPLALLGEILFVIVVVSSVYIARKHLKYESWYYVHLLVYVAIVVSFFHQTVVGDTFVGHPLNQLFWYAIYGFVALNVVYFRVALPVIDHLTHGFTVTKVEPTSSTTTSLYITGKNMQSWNVRAGQFVFLRILQPGYLFQEHPFSLSQLPDESGTLRVSIRKSGDYTNTIPEVKVGSKIEVSRAFGSFTHERALRPKRLYIAGGIGITPLVPLARESIAQKVVADLLYANTTTSDVPLKTDVQRLTKNGVKVHYFYSQEPVPPTAHSGYIDTTKIAALVPDYAERDIYICGPPIMMYGIVDQLRSAGVPEAQLHFERFALHDQKKTARKPALGVVVTQKA